MRNESENQHAFQQINTPIIVAAYCVVLIRHRQETSSFIGSWPIHRDIVGEFAVRVRRARTYSHAAAAAALIHTAVGMHAQAK